MFIALRHALAGLLNFSEGFEDDRDQVGLPDKIQAARAALAPPEAEPRSGKTWPLGPWQLKELGDANHYTINDRTGRWAVYVLLNGELWLDKQRAMGRLIAAAPTLHETQERLCRAVESAVGDIDAQGELSAALADARAALALCAPAP